MYNIWYYAFHKRFVKNSKHYTYYIGTTSGIILLLSIVINHTVGLSSYNSCVAYALYYIGEGASGRIDYIDVATFNI
jgi:hypothetical protein